MTATPRSHAASRRALIRQAERRRLEVEREAGSDSVFGIEWRPYAPGRHQTVRGRVSWKVDVDAFGALMGLARLREVLLAGIELRLVDELRDGGVSWEDIGFALEITGEGARRKFADQVAALREHEHG